MAAPPDYELVLAAGCADCPVCGGAASVVRPDFCTEGHGTECPDRMCVSCGSALAIGPAADPARAVSAGSALPGGRRTRTA